MIRRHLFLLTLLFAPAIVTCGDAESLLLIRQAYEDHLYLQVEERSRRYFQDAGNDAINSESEQVILLYISSLCERGLWEEALKKVLSFETDHAKSPLLPTALFFTAKCLYEGWIVNGKVIPESVSDTRPAEILENILPQLADSSRIFGNLPAQGLFIQALDYFDRANGPSYALANETFQKLYQNHKNFSFIEDVEFYLGQSYYFMGEYERALKFIERLSAKHKRSIRYPEFLYWKGQCLFELNQLDQAEKVFGEALNAKPEPSTEADVLYSLGWLHAYAGRRDRSILTFQSLLSPELEPYAKRYSDSIRLKLSNLFYVDKRIEEGLDILKPVLNSPILRHRAHLMMARFYLQQSNWQAALDNLLQAELSDDLLVATEARKLKAQSFYEMGRLEESLQILTQMENGEIPLEVKLDIQLQKAEVFFACNEVYQARNIYLDLLEENDPTLNPGLYYKLAKCSMRTSPLAELLHDRGRLKFLSGTELVKSKSLANLENKLENALTNLWSLAAQTDAPFNRKRILEILELVCSNYQSKEEPSDDKIPAPDDEALQFTTLKKTYIELFRAGTLIPEKTTDMLAELAMPLPQLQNTTVRSYLEKIIDLKTETPFLALAYYESARLSLEQNQWMDAAAGFTKAIDHASHPDNRSLYLFQLAVTHYQMAESIEIDKETGKPVDAKRKTSLLKNALARLEQLESEKPDYGRLDVTRLKFNCYRQLNDFRLAEKCLQTFLDQGGKAEEVNEIEELLISFYLAQGNPLKAAMQMEEYAGLVIKDDNTYSRLIYQAAQIYLENTREETWVKSGEDMMLALSKALPANEWTFRASLKSINILHSRGELEKANDLAAGFQEPHGLSQELLMEKEAALAFHELALGRPEDARQRFSVIMQQAPAQGALRAQAYLKFAELSAKDHPGAAADAYYDFYYLFPGHPFRQEALQRCCRNRITLYRSNKPEPQVERELRILISKLENHSNRAQLLSFLEKGTETNPE